MTKRINDAGLAVLKEFEQGPGGGPALVAYRCPAGVLTIGWGSTRGVTEGMTITFAEAEGRLRADVAEAEAAVNRLAPSANEFEFSAMVSLTYNIGSAAFAKSTVLKRHRAGDAAGAAAAFGMWNKATGANGKLQELRGLTRRRAAEAALYLTPDRDEDIIDPQRTRAADTEERAEGVSRVAVTTVATATTLGGSSIVGAFTSNPELAASVVTTGMQHAPWLLLAVFVVAVVGFGVWRLAQMRKVA